MPVIVCWCCFLDRCGRPWGYVALRSLGGPWWVMLVCGLVNGLPRATDHVSHGGASMMVCTRPLYIWFCQKVTVSGLRRS